MKNQNAKQGRTEIERARQIRKSLGITTAARYLRKLGWTLDGALFALLGAAQRFEEIPS